MSLTVPKRALRNLVSLLCSLTASLYWIAYPAMAAVGEVDKTFANDGVEILPTTSDFPTAVTGPVVQSDGGIVVCGIGITSDGSQYTPTLYRVKRKGFPDPEFGVSGSLDIGVSLDYAECAGLTRGVDDAIIGMGYQGMGEAPNRITVTTLFKRKKDGAPDLAFGDGGFARIRLTNDSINSNDVAKAFAIQSNGAIVLGSAFSFNELNFVRLDSNGKLDSAFGLAGYETIKFVGTASSLPYITSIAIDAHDRIVVAFSVSDPSEDLQDFWVLRLRSDGAKDSTFGHNGYATIHFDQRASDPMVVMVDSADRILVAGTSYAVDTGDGDVAVVRLLNDGSLDSGFGENGKAIVPVDLDSGRRMALPRAGVFTREGKIVLAGFARDTYLNHALILQFSADGQLDESFGNVGVSVLDPIPGAWISQELTGIAVQDSGYIVTGTATSNNSNKFNGFISRVDGLGNRATGHSQHALPRLPIGRQLSAKHLRVQFP